MDTSAVSNGQFGMAITCCSNIFVLNPFKIKSSIQGKSGIEFRRGQSSECTIGNDDYEPYRGWLWSAPISCLLPHHSFRLWQLKRDSVSAYEKGYSILDCFRSLVFWMNSNSSKFARINFLRKGISLGGGRYVLPLHAFSSSPTLNNA